MTLKRITNHMCDTLIIHTSIETFKNKKSQLNFEVMNKSSNTEKRRCDIPTSANHMWFPDFRETRQKTQGNYGKISSEYSGKGGNPKWLKTHLCKITTHFIIIYIFRKGLRWSWNEKYCGLRNRTETYLSL